MIFSEHVGPDGAELRCNGSGLYVDPTYRAFAPVLIKRVLRYKNVLYLNLTPGKPTWPMLEAQGYRRFVDGMFFTPAGLHRGTLAQLHSPIGSILAKLEAFEVDLLRDHAAFGCLCVIAEHDDQFYPFVFGIRKKYLVPFAHLIYCRNQDDFFRFAGVLGRYLARRGFPLVALYANGPIRELIGGYIAMRPMFYLGCAPPRSADLSYTEQVMFGY